jgi:hypothetical protein
MKSQKGSTLSLTSTFYCVSCQRHAPTASPPGKTRYALYSRLDGPQDRSGRVRKISPPPRFDPRTVQPVASRYTDWAIAAHNKVHVLDYLCTPFGWSVHPLSQHYLCTPFPNIICAPPFPTLPHIFESTLYTVWCLGTRLNQRLPNCCSRIPWVPRPIARVSVDTFPWWPLWSLLIF